MIKNDINLFNYKHSEFNLKKSYKDIPVNKFKFNEDDVNEFNAIYSYVKNTYAGYKYLMRTKKGYISQLNNPPAWEIRGTKSYKELTLITEEGMWRFIIRNTSDIDTITGTEAFNRLNYYTKKLSGVNIFQYSIDNGKKVKETIPDLIIKAEDDSIFHQTFENVHHLDLNSSFISGIIESFPAIRPAAEFIYKERMEEKRKRKAGDPTYDEEREKELKGVLTNSQGYMQSEIINYCLAHLAKAGIEFNNNKIYELADKLRNSGRKILLYNTDGIWYQGEEYHDVTEGEELGQWKNDHRNCTLRAKSKGAYEYIEAGKYFPVVRGETNLQKIKPKSEWVWGDLYVKGATVINKYIWTDNGYIHIEEEID